MTSCRPAEPSYRTASQSRAFFIIEIPHHFICNLYGSGPADVPTEGGLDVYQPPHYNCLKAHDSGEVGRTLELLLPQSRTPRRGSKDKAELFPHEHQKCGQVTSKCKEEAGQVLLLKGGVYWDSQGSCKLYVPLKNEGGPKK